LTDRAYRAFFHREAQRGAKIIVDNGVFDLGRALPATDLIEAARAVDADEIILPDVMGDGPCGCRLLRPCRSCGMLVLMENAAEPISSKDVKLIKSA
jgi:hypothetical protein